MSLAFPSLPWSIQCRVLCLNIPKTGVFLFCILWWSSHAEQSMELLWQEILTALSFNPPWSVTSQFLVHQVSNFITQTNLTKWAAYQVQPHFTDKPLDRSREVLSNTKSYCQPAFLLCNTSTIKKKSLYPCLSMLPWPTLSSSQTADLPLWLSLYLTLIASAGKFCIKWRRSHKILQEHSILYGQVFPVHVYAVKVYYPCKVGCVAIVYKIVF